MTRCWRPLALTAALHVTAGLGTAAAQTLFVRNAGPGTPVEVVVNGTKAGAGTADAGGDATVAFSLQAQTGKDEMDANVTSRHAHQLSHRRIKLKVKSAHDITHRARVIVLQKLVRQSDLGELIGPERLEEESPVVFKRFRNDDDDAVEMGAFYSELHRSSGWNAHRQRREAIDTRFARTGMSWCPESEIRRHSAGAASRAFPRPRPAACGALA